MDYKLAKKLKLQPEEKNLILQAPDSFAEALQGIAYDTSAAGKDYDYVQLFVHSIDELNTYAKAALEAVKEDGKLWCCYPRKSSGIKTDINRDKGWDVLRAAGYAGVAAVSIDDTWSALRFRPESRIDRRPDSSMAPGASQPASRELEIPEYLRLALAAHPQEKQFFESLAYTHRKEYVQWVTEARREDTRQRRLQQTLELLKEGKKERYQ